MYLRNKKGINRCECKGESVAVFKVRIIEANLLLNMSILLFVNEDIVTNT